VPELTADREVDPGARADLIFVNDEVARPTLCWSDDHLAGGAR